MLITTSRYCCQTNFSFVIAGGEEINTGLVSGNVSNINVNSLSKTFTVSSLNHVRKHSKIVCINGEVYVFGGIDFNYKPVMAVEKFHLILILGII